MNARSYKTVFSKRLGALVAVGEHASSQGKANGAGSGGGASGALSYVAALTASFALVSLAWAQPATNALPTSGQVVQGAASTSQTANQMAINQSTQRAAINWQSFDIGAQAKVNVVQPNAQAVLLNRVVGQSPSQIFGQLNANGHVILVNPNGVLFGKDGSVNAASFTASTLGISDANFMAGNMVYERNGSTAGIVNEGIITTAPGGYVALLGASVSNEGKIDTKGGNVFLGAADTIKVPVSGTGRIKLELSAADMNANVSNSGSIITQGGQVYMQALALNQAAAQIIQSGSIDTTGEQGGAVHLLADGGTIKVDGSITANSTGSSAGGDIYIGRDKDTNILAAVGDVRGAKLESKSGFVETSGQYLATTGVSVKAKEWLLDPTDIKIVDIDSTTFNNTANNGPQPTGGTQLFQDTTIVQTTEVLKLTIETAINNGTNVTISTANGPGTGEGNITIETALSFTNSIQEATLKLEARNGITQNAGASITAMAGSKAVNVEMKAEGLPGGIAVGAAGYDATKSKGIVLNSSISTNGRVKIEGTNNNTAGSSSGIRFNSGSSITAASFDIQGKATGPESRSHGVLFEGGSNLTAPPTISIISTGTGSSVINGTSKITKTGITAGTNINGNVAFDAQNNGLIIVKGSNDVNGIGLRISAFDEATKVTTNGRVTLGALEPNSSFSLRNGSITANSGSLNILGSSVSNFGGESITANNGVSINIEGKTTPGIGSNAVGFTNMTIKALQGAATSAGNINITGTSSTGNAINLQPSVTIEGRDVTLKGTADNGTAASGAAINGSGKITASGAVVIEGVSANTGGYSTLTNGPISASGDITIKGTGTAKHGVFLGNNVAGNNITSTGGKITIKGDTTGDGGINGSASGVAITGNAIITADKDVTITGKTHGNPAINGLGNITSNNGNVTIDGYSRESRGVNYDKTITANNGNINIIGSSGVDGTVTSTASNAGNEHGVYFSGLAKANNVTIQGTSINNVGTFVGSSSGTNIDATDKVTITGTSNAGTGVNLGSINGFGFFQSTIKSGQNTEVSGKGLTGVRVWGTSSINAGTTTSQGSIKILGETIDTTAAQTGTGVDFQRFPTAASMKASKDIYIEGILNGLGNGAGIQTSISGTNGQSPTFTAGESFTLRGNNRGATTNTNPAINARSGLQVTAGKNIVVQAETKNDSARAMEFYSLNDGVRGNTSFVSTGGDVLIQSNQGAITFNNQQSSSIGKLTDITGRNITIDNTGAGMATGAGNLVGSGGTKGDTIGTGSVDVTTGVVVAGAGKGNAEGINFADGRNITATDRLNIMGAAKSGLGIQNITTLTGGTVNIKGISDGNSAGVNTTGRIVSTVGDVSLEGTSALGAGVNMTSSAATPAIEAKKKIIIKGTSNGNADAQHGVVLLGTTTVQGENVTIEGSSVNGNGVINTAAINATSGDVEITGTSTGTTASASALSLQGAITASNNVAIVGSNTNAANASMIAYINKAVTATDGKVDVTTQTAGTAAAGLRLDTGANLNGKTEVNIKTDSLNMTTAGSAPAVISAGTTGLVTIKTDSASAKIDIGNGTGTSGVDVGSATTNDRVLGLSNAELDRITAGNLVIGDSLNKGGIKVSAATTTLAQAGNITLQTGGNIAVNAVLTVGDDPSTAGIEASKNLTLNGVSTQSAAIKAAGLELLGANATHALTNTGNQVGTLATDTKSVEFTNGSALTVGKVNDTTGIKTKDGASVITQSGNLHLTEAITNSTSGNVVVGAGVTDAAGVTTGGDVKTTDTKTISNNGTGKTYIYSGKASSTGTLSYLHNSLTDLYLDGTTAGKAQNADSGVAYGATIAGGATTQVLFREKVNVSLQENLSGATLNKTYGDASTSNGQSAALWTDMQGALKASNSNNGISNQLTSTMKDANNNDIKFHVSAATVISDLTGMIQGDTYSSANFLKANNAANNNANGYSYNVPTSAGKYTIKFADNAVVKAVIGQKALTGSISSGSSTYGESLNLGTGTLTNVVSGDKVSPGSAKVDLTAANTSSSGRLKAGSHTQTLSGLSGDDSANYSHTGVTGSYTVKPKELTINVGTVADKNATGSTTAVVTPGGLNGVLSGEQLSVSATGNFVDPNVGNGKVVNALYTLQNGVKGEAENYVLNIGTPANPDSRLRGNILATVNPVINPTPSPVNNNTGGSRVSTVSGFGGSGAATGVLDDKLATESREICSDLNPENCECQPSVIPTIEICFAPKSLASNKEEK